MNDSHEYVIPPTVLISPRGAERARQGHLWIYRSDVMKVSGATTGDVVRVEERNGKFVAWAHFGAESEITLRLLSFSETPIDRDFWVARLKSAIEWRSRVVQDTDSYRVVHAEGDLLPGLIVDRYGDVLVIQTLTRGMDALKQMWVQLLLNEYWPRLIVERNDVKVRTLEGLPLLSGILYRRDDAEETNATEFEISENGLRFAIDVINGQKTGAFLDQRENRAAAMKYAWGRGLDCFTFHGSFAAHLARSCETVTAIDISGPAVERATRTAEMNGLSNLKFLEGNVFDELHRFDLEGSQFEMIVLDPPAFAKNRRSVEAALRGYKEINLRAFKLLVPGGILVTCSCSYHVSEEMFVATVTEAARDAKRQVQVIETRTQGRDHPILLTVPETFYLKCLILRVF